MAYKTPRELATERYALALAALRRARERYLAARVPVDLVDGKPPRLTVEQHDAMHAYAIAWGQFARSMHAAAAFQNVTAPTRAGRAGR